MAALQVKAASDAHVSADGSQPAQPIPSGISVVGGNAAYNAKMEEHLKEQQQQLEHAQQALADAQKAESQYR